ncbi:ABC-2 family transporter protein [candidate division WWE3 bacterium]|uniref:ABC-2 family transporter protein n=1 Tax=candidate division WWE3 bacterium TaxID=2053526 RepID=A0A955LKJ9_UNCKA|nr:ABC-2 family transporter protein [candidate division WWE3 bacterium]
MRKTKAILVTVLKNNFEYKAEVIYWLVLSLIPLFITTFLWLTVYQDSGVVADYTLPALVTYYIVAFIIQRLSELPTFWLSRLITSGYLSAHLLRPVSFFQYGIVSVITRRLINFTISLPVVIFVLWLLRSYFQLPSGMGVCVAFVLAVFIAVTMYAIFGFLLGSIAFWTSEVGSIFYTYNLILTFLGGGSLPLSFFPDWLVSIINLLPFRYLYAFPIEVYLGRLSTVQIITGLLQGVFWLFALLMFFGFVWRRGVRAYEAYGG